MKLVISYDGVKREISGDFAICANAESLRTLAKAIEDKLEPFPNFYGWMEVREPLKPLEITSNQEPLSWSDKA